MTDFDDVKDPGRNQRFTAKDKVNLLSLTKGAWTPVRFVGGLTAYGRYWIQSKNKDGKAIRYSIPCPSFDPKTQERDSTIFDPWRDAEAVLRAEADARGSSKKGKGKDDRKQQLAISFASSMMLMPTCKLSCARIRRMRMHNFLMPSRFRKWVSLRRL